MTTGMSYSANVEIIIVRGRVGINSPRVKISDLRKHEIVGSRVGSGMDKWRGSWMVKSLLDLRAKG
jgi:hypothetical protein